ncbi:hypothetical protein C8R46DRAFT_1345366 [Mycena filopes]|nr:hypothetical protein C8R46DRAFT_1345366 [Mycena filopes]
MVDPDTESLFAHGGDSDPPLPVAIGCYFVIRKDGDLLVDEMIVKIQVPPTMLTRRGTALSIPVAGLLLSLQLHQAFGNKIKEGPIRDMIHGGSRIAVGSTLSTTRVPDFKTSPGYAAPAAGFRDLISLQQAHTQNFFPSSTVIDNLDSEIIAALEKPSNVAAAELFRVWEPLGIVPESTFIIIVTIPHPSTALLPAILTTAPSFTWSQETQPASPHPTLSQDSAYFDISSYAGPDTVYASPSRHSTPYLDFAGYSLPTESSQQPMNQEFPVASSPALVCGKKRNTRNRSSSLMNHFQRIIDDRLLGDLHSAAQFSSGSAVTLTKMIRQHEAMVDLLLSLGLKVERLTATTLITFADGSDSITLGGTNALHACGWAVQTFTNKWRIFPPAKLSSQLLWRGSAPSPTEIPAYREYQAWYGARYLWSALGSVQTGIEPNSASSVAPGEAEAAILNQTLLGQITSVEFRKKYLEASQLSPQALTG